MPAPPILFYFHTLLVNGNSDARASLRRILRYKISLLLDAMWWLEARLGDSGVVVPKETIVWLKVQLGKVPIYPNTTHGPRQKTKLSYIAARMRDFLYAPI